MSEMTLEQRREALRRQQDELAKLEAEAEREARLNKQREEERAQEEARAAQNRRRDEIVNNIRAAIVVHPHWQSNLSFTLTQSGFAVNGDTPFSCYIDLNQKYDGGRFHRKEVVGHYDITVGHYGDRKRFPAHKDGSNNYDKIADLLVTKYNAHAASVKREQVRTSNKEANAAEAQRLRDQFGLRGYGSFTVQPATIPDAVVVKLPEATHLSPDKAEQLLKTLREIGLI